MSDSNIRTCLFALPLVVGFGFAMGLCAMLVTFAVGSGWAGLAVAVLPPAVLAWQLPARPLPLIQHIGLVVLAVLAGCGTFAWSTSGYAS